MAKTYQLANDGPHGSSIKIVPVTTDTELNKATCLKVEGNAEMQFKPQTIVPDTTGMQVNAFYQRIKTLFVSFLKKFNYNRLFVYFVDVVCRRGNDQWIALRKVADARNDWRKIEQVHAVDSLQGNRT